MHDDGDIAFCHQLIPNVPCDEFQPPIATARHDNDRGGLKVSDGLIDGFSYIGSIQEARIYLDCICFGSFSELT